MIRPRLLLLVAVAALACSSPSQDIDGGGTPDGGGAPDGASPDSAHVVDGATADVPVGGDGGCVPTSVNDQPDPAFLDQNCDGIDGDAADGIFVAVTGTDSASCGLDRAHPCETVTKGIDRAVATGRGHVYVQAGDMNTAALPVGELRSQPCE